MNIWFWEDERGWWWWVTDARLVRNTRQEGNGPFRLIGHAKNSARAFYKKQRRTPRFLYLPAREPGE